MKAKIQGLLTLTFLIASVGAHAGNEGPVGAPSPRPGIVAEVTTFVGFAPPEFRGPRGTRIYGDGTVVSFFRDETHDLAKLSPETLAKIVAIVAKIPTDSTLVDYDAGQSMCYDAPTTAYEAIVNGTRVRFAQQAGCHQFGLKNGEGYQLRSILDGLNGLPR